MYTPSRRSLLWLLSVAPLAWIVNRSARAQPLPGGDPESPETPGIPGTQLPERCDKSSPEFLEAKKSLWDEFYAGTREWYNPFRSELESEQLWREKDDLHGAFLCANWDRWTTAPEQQVETRRCCHLAGQLAEVIRRSEGTKTITKAQFEGAVDGVSVYQKRKYARPDVGMVC